MKLPGNRLPAVRAEVAVDAKIAAGVEVEAFFEDFSRKIKAVFAEPARQTHKVGAIALLQRYRIFKTNRAEIEIFADDKLHDLQRRGRLRRHPRLVVKKVITNKVCLRRQFQPDERQAVGGVEGIFDRFFKIILPQKSLAHEEPVMQQRRRAALTEQSRAQLADFAETEQEFAADLVFAEIGKQTERAFRPESESLGRRDGKIARREQVGNRRVARFLVQFDERMRQPDGEDIRWSPACF